MTKTFDLSRARWRKSSHSAQSQGNCVEVAASTPVAVRDSKNLDAGILAVPRPAWTAFIADLKRSR